MTSMACLTHCQIDMQSKHLRCAETMKTEKSELSAGLQQMQKHIYINKHKPSNCHL